MSELQSLTGLKSRVDALRAKAERARGVAEQVESDLKETWKCDSLEAASKLLKKMRSKEGALLKRYEEELKAFEEKWAEELSRL